MTPPVQVLVCPCGAKLVDPFLHTPTHPAGYVPNIRAYGPGSDYPGAQRLAWHRAHAAHFLEDIARKEEYVLRSLRAR